MKYCRTFETQIKEKSRKQWGMNICELKFASSIQNFTLSYDMVTCWIFLRLCVNASNCHLLVNLPNPRQQVWVSRVLGVTIINECSVSQNMWHLKNLTAQLPWVPSVGRNLKPFTGNGDLSIWVKNYRVGHKTLNKQKTCKLKIDIIFWHVYVMIWQIDLINVKSFCQVMMSTCQMLCQLVQLVR